MLGDMLLLLTSCQPEIHTSGVVDTGVASALAMTEVSPDQGPVSGGTTVTLRGRGFSTATAVSVGGKGCTTLTYLSSAELLCITPAGSAGETQIVATDGALTSSASYTYLAPDDDSGGTETGINPVVIESCTLVGPATMTSDLYARSEDVTGRVLVAARTPGEGSGIGIDAELGFGPTGSDPNTWDWAGIAWVAEAADPAEGEEWAGAFYPEDPGAITYAVRFRVDHGPWSMCELESGGYGSGAVLGPTDPDPIDYCHVQWPCSMEANAGEATPDVYGWAYEFGVTMGIGAGKGVLMDLGIGADGSDPASGAWTWTAMAWFGDKDGLKAGDLANDEYMGHGVAPATAGTYDYAVRTSADYGLSWTYCDLGGNSCAGVGSTDGYSTSNTGSLTVH